MLTRTPLWPELPASARSVPPRRGGRARRRRRWAIGIVVGAASLVVAAGSAYALDLFEPGPAGPPAVLAEARAAGTESVTLRADLVGGLESARAVLESPDGEAAKTPARRALRAAIKDAERVALDEAAGLDDVRATSAALREAADAVVVSGQGVRLARGVSGLKSAQADLRAAAAEGEEVQVASAADAAGRDALRSALDEAADLTARAGDVLGRVADVHADLPAETDTLADVLGQAKLLTKDMARATADIGEAVAAVPVPAEDDATSTGADGTDPAAEDDDAGDTGTTPVGTCPEPDQVWSAENGHLAASELAQIPFASGSYVRADVVGDLTELNAAYAAEFGTNLTINSSYRTYAEQEALYDPSSKTAAPPGCSNHGTGLAIDIGGGVQAFGSAQYEWLKANAEDYGWVHPPFAEPSGRNPEPWHWQSVLAPNSY
ncbi:M15 family metallopeptidase [Promicromonospora sp. NPDC057488]|uniref:M15 family metallopeptidase n=1 Tax=Promicromonospora sp. NPDC057488 TaxID=3346147 RepID=UPI0036729467